MLAVVVAVIAITKGQRRIPIQYAKRMIGRTPATISAACLNQQLITGPGPAQAHND